MTYFDFRATMFPCYEIIPPWEEDIVKTFESLGNFTYARSKSKGPYNLMIMSYPVTNLKNRFA